MIRTVLTNEFERCAREYCEVKVRHVDLNRLIRLAPCEFEGDPDCRPCWLEIEEGAICLDEACESCQTTHPLVEQRRALGKRIPNLAKAMYATLRKEGAL